MDIIRIIHLIDRQGNYPESKMRFNFVCCSNKAVKKLKSGRVVYVAERLAYCGYFSSLACPLKLAGVFWDMESLLEEIR